MWLNGGAISEGNDVTIVEESTFKSLITASAVADGGKSLTGYGKGWGKMLYFGHEVGFHLIEPERTN